VRARLKWILGVLGVAWLIAYLRRRHAPPQQAAPDPRAEELRRTLEESREAAAAGISFACNSHHLIE